jgi:RNA polymerase sigma factor (sigma-70 family)
MSPWLPRTHVAMAHTHQGSPLAGICVLPLATKPGSACRSSVAVSLPVVTCPFGGRGRGLDTSNENPHTAVDRLLLGDALAQLPADHRAVVRCAYCQGCTTAQIAADLHIAEGTVKLRLHDALRALSLQLREMGVALQ